MPKPKKLDFSSAEALARVYDENIRLYGDAWGKRKLSLDDRVQWAELVRKEVRALIEAQTRKPEK